MYQATAFAYYVGHDRNRFLHCSDEEIGRLARGLVKTGGSSSFHLDESGLGIKTPKYSALGGAQRSCGYHLAVGLCLLHFSFELNNSSRCVP